MRALITGVAGFVGSHLTSYLSTDFKEEIIGIDIKTDNFFNNEIISGLSEEIKKNIKLLEIDLEDRSAVEGAINEYRPDSIYHLAAQSSVSFSWDDPVSTFKSNVFSGINILESIKKLEKAPKTLIVCTAEEYEPVDSEAIDEKGKIFPSNPYAISKAALDFFTITYHRAYALPVFVSRSFNHIGPGQSERFVVSDFAKQIAQIEKGIKEPSIHVGNLQAQRDFLDVRDVVRAYKKIIDKGTPGQAYNVCSANKYRVSDLLEKLVSLSTKKNISIIEVKDKFRPVDNKIIYGNNYKITKDTGWKPYYSIAKSLKETLDYWRARI